MLKPRQEASAIGIKKIHTAEELWPVLEQLGDKQSSYLLEKFLPGDVYHVDSVVSENEVVFANVSKYGKPPMNVAQGGGIFTTFTVPRGSEDDSALRAINRDLIAALGLLRGVAHAEFIRAHADGQFYFLECAARVGGAYINEMVEAATGINLWREWARIEIAGGDGSYKLPPVREEYAGVILSLARQEDPDTSAYNDPEVYLRIKRHHHAGLVLRSTDPQRIPTLLDDYARRFARRIPGGRAPTRQADCLTCEARAPPPATDAPDEPLRGRKPTRSEAEGAAAPHFILCYHFAYEHDHRACRASRTPCARATGTQGADLSLHLKNTWPTRARPRAAFWIRGRG